MSSIVATFGLDRSLFYHFALFLILFTLMRALFFDPFMGLIQERRKRTLADRELAAKLLEDAGKKLSEYESRLASARQQARKEMDLLIGEARKKEADTLANAREESKKITQATLHELESQRASLQKDLSKEVDAMASTISERLIRQQGERR